MADNLEALFKEALDEFVGRESALVRKNAHEKSMCHRLAWYVEHSKNRHGLEGYWVDTEYNRHGDNVKKIRHAVTGEPINIICDILLHSRGELPDDNLIAVEMKKADGKEVDKQTDRERLQALTTACPEGNPPDHVCGYKLAYYVEVDVKTALLLVEEYREGKLTQKSSLTFFPAPGTSGGSRSDSIPFSKNESESREETKLNLKNSLSSHLR
jgi:hypothetical protein